ncbi:MAG: PQQ-binding-like beta-propeller repeat protein [Acidaminococcaceae bacterium]|nr:PQQ-binding-like beta-propeller repeat protein [Acidaminococcaceae bacterium]
MKNSKGYIALVILFFTWFFLFWITGDRAPWQFFSHKNIEGVEVYLGDIPIQNYDRMGFTKGVVRYVVRNNFWLVGTERGELFCFDAKGKQLWKRSLGIGKLVTMALSKKQDLVYVGEQSPTGQIFAIQVSNGNLVWKYATENFVGSDPGKRSYPSVVHIVVDDYENIYLTAYRYLLNKDGSRGYNGKICAFNKDGTVKWQFPKKEVMDTWVNWCDVSNSTGEIVAATSAYEIRPGMKYGKTMYFLNKETGKLQHSLTLPIVAPFENVVMRGSPNYSADGNYLAGSSSDGRAFLLNANGKILWTRILSLPQKIEGAWLNASGRDGFVVPEGAIFTPINTFNRENWQLPTPVVHTCSNSLFLFALKGDFKYKYQAAGTMEELAFANGMVACAVGRNVRTHDYAAAHGVILINLSDGSLIKRFATQGPMQAVDISPDGKYIGGIEAPAVTPEGKVIGAYRFHIWDYK